MTVTVAAAVISPNAVTPMFTASKDAEMDYYPWHEKQEAPSIFAPSKPAIKPAIGKFDARTKAKKPLSRFIDDPVSKSVDDPYHSPRVRALVENGSQLKSHAPTAKLEYASVRTSGMSLGYNLFTQCPTPQPRSEGPAPLVPSNASWMVDVATLETGDAGAALAGKQRSKRRKDAQVLMRHNPTVLVVDEAKDLNAAAARLAALDTRLAEARKRVDVQASALSAAGGGKPNSSLVEAVRGAGTFAREVVALHAKANAEVQQLASALDERWRKLQGDGQAARKAALTYMVEIEEKLQEELEAVMLRLTDHVLLGTAEEAERMASTPGPDGEQLRALYLEQSKLASRQRLQRAVLVQVAKKAVAAVDAHETRMAKALSKLGNYSDARAALSRATDALSAALTSASGSSSFLSAEEATKRAVDTKVAKEVPLPKGTVAQSFIGLGSGAAMPTPAADESPGREVRFAAGGAQSAASATSQQPPPIQYMTVRPPAPTEAPRSGWLAKIVSLNPGSASVLGLGLARDDSLPSVIVDGGLLQRTNSAKIRAELPGGGKRKPSDKVFELAKALTVATVSPTGPANGQILERDVIVAVNGTDVTGTGLSADLLHLVGGKPGAVRSGGFGRTVELTVVRPQFDAPKPKPKGIISRAFRAVTTFRGKKKS